MEKLYINYERASLHGVVMGDNFIDTLEKPLEMKEYISNESRLEHGVRMIVKNPKVKGRSLTLTFVITGATYDEYRTNKAWLLGEFYKGKVRICIGDIDEEHIYNLVYTGKSISYAESITRCIGKLSVGFDEPNPMETT